jgi:hypothetical protein
MNITSVGSNSLDSTFIQSHHGENGKREEFKCFSKHFSLVMAVEGGEGGLSGKHPPPHTTLHVQMFNDDLSFIFLSVHISFMSHSLEETIYMFFFCIPK